ncbi:MADF domain-containing protein [Aphelenchoides besseyi]|nr:MADF domain-containing protein [Aphelenchoides besseyi]KAI6207694.1 MADF domain-containing protein [Aphelenchoides besseyi]
MTTTQFLPSTDDSSNDQPEVQKRKSRIALYSDELRLDLIRHVYSRPAVWRLSNRESVNAIVSATVRRKNFDEIAQLLQPKNTAITGSQVEKQWKNLKDTYNKVKKKQSSEIPRWRFFRILKFIDPDEAISKGFDFGKEFEDLQKEYELNDIKIVTTTSDLTNTSISDVVPLHSTTVQSIKSPNSRHKRKTDEEIAYVEHSKTNSNVSFKASKVEMSSSANQLHDSRDQFNGTSTAGQQLNGSVSIEDEYVIFCKSLIHPLKEISEHDRLLFCKTQKEIRDLIFNAQTKIHSSKNKNGKKD